MSALIAAICLILVAAAAAGLFVARAALPRLRSLLADIRATREAAERSSAMAVVSYQGSRGTFDLFPRQDAAAHFPNGEWRRIGGGGVGWPRSDFYKIRGLAFCEGKLHASLTGPRQDGDRGEVWSWNGSEWDHAGGGGDSWPANPAFVDHLHVHRDTLLAAVGPRIWRKAKGSWQAVAEVSNSEGAGAYCFAEHASQLVIGCWGKPAVFILGNDDRLQRIVDPLQGWGGGARTIYCLCSFGEQLYAATGTGKLSGDASSVFRYDGSRWEKVGGGGIRGSWSEDGIAFVLSLIVFKDMLVATLSRRPGTIGAASSVWAFDGHEWRPAGVGLTPAGMARATILNDAIVYKGRLIVATGSSTGREAGAFSFERKGWLDIAGDAFTPENAGARYGGYWIYRMASDGERLYAASAGHEGAAGLFEFVPTASNPSSVT